MGGQCSEVLAGWTFMDLYYCVWESERNTIIILSVFFIYPIGFVRNESLNIVLRSRFSMISLLSGNFLSVRFGPVVGFFCLIFGTFVCNDYFLRNKTTKLYIFHVRYLYEVG